MSQTLLEMATDLVREVIRVHQILPDDARALLLSTHATLLSLQQGEAPGGMTVGPDTGEDAPADWQRTITRHAIFCLECGDAFRQLSIRHLRRHNLDARSYREKYGIPKTQALSSRRATARRRELARQIRPWEAAASKRAGTR